MGTAIVVTSGKGGTGKTSITGGVAGSLARLGHSVLCIDMDIGLRNLDISLGLSDRALMDFSDVAEGRCPLVRAAVNHPDLPGLPLKILVPSLQVTLLDSLNKRVDWLAQVSAQLSLTGIRVIHARAEEQALEKGFRDSFELVTARAVAELRLLCELCLPYVKVGGAFLAMKSVDCGRELEEAAHCIKLLGARLEECRDYTIPGTDVIHRLVVLRKVAPTLKGYPRRWAKIQKAPL